MKKKNLRRQKILPSNELNKYYYIFVNVKKKKKNRFSHTAKTVLSFRICVWYISTEKKKI